MIQELISDGVPSITRYQSKLDKTMRLHSATSVIENGLSCLTRLLGFAPYIHELITFPIGKFDDQADSTSQALDWYPQRCTNLGIFVFWREEYKKFLREEGRLKELQDLEEKYPM